MTKRLYYDQPDLLEFDSIVENAEPAPSASTSDPNPTRIRPSIILRETAFYPTSGGQVYDTGWITLTSGEKLRVAEVADLEDGRIIHYFDAPIHPPMNGARVHGSIDPDRRRDHMQQHTGQHVLSAAFIELYQFPTVSFHMGDDYCSIDLATPTVTSSQVIGAEKRANEIVFENRPVSIRYVHREEAERLGLRKLPPEGRDELRLIEVADFDLSACGGTHVNSTGRIGSILLRKVEKTRQGTRVEFVCGDRAVRVARRDYTTLTEAAALYSAQLSDVPEMIRKSFEESKGLRRERELALEDLAAAMAQRELGLYGTDTPVSAVSASDSTAPSEAPVPDKSADGRIVIVRAFSDRDTSFAKLFAQKATRIGVPVIALVGSSMDPPGLVFAQTSGAQTSGAQTSGAQTSGGTADMGALLKQVLASVGGRGGGSRDFAQGGVPPGSDVEQLLRQAAATIKS